MIHGCEENNFVVTADMMRPYVTERTKALILNSPNNPNGCVWSRQELADIAALAVECGFYVISDEIYEKLIYDDEKHYCMASFGPEIKKQCIVVNGVSKTYAMTGWRIGLCRRPKERHQGDDLVPEPRHQRRELDRASTRRRRRCPAGTNTSFR